MATDRQESPQWDLGRFVKTLSYFGAVPFLSSLDWFQQWFGNRPDPKVDSAPIAQRTVAAQPSSVPPAPEAILVCGATASLGRQVVHRLIDEGYAVRLLVPQGSAADFATLGDRLSIVQADSTLPDTLTSAAQGVKTLIYCAEQAIDLQPLEHLVNTLEAAGLSRQPLFDFSQPADNLKEIWGALDDVVMGGVSQSGIQFQPIANFSGTVSTANSGGFASVRTRNFAPALDLSSYDGIELRVKGDGNRYKFMLRDEDRWDGIAYCSSFDTAADRWITIRIPFSSLIPVFRAKTVSDRTFNPSHTYACQLMLSKFEYDGALNPHFQPGFFQLQVESIQVYRHDALPTLIVVSGDRSTAPIAELLQKGDCPFALLHPVDGRVDRLSSRVNPADPVVELCDQVLTHWRRE